MNKCKWTVFLFLLNLFLLNNAWAVDSSNSYFRVTTNPNQIIMMESGWIARSPTPNNKYQYLNTTKHCPNGFNPYIDMRFSKIYHPGATTAGTGHLRNFGICVVQLSDRGTNYQIIYWSINNFADVVGLNTYSWAWDYGEASNEVYGTTRVVPYDIGSSNRIGFDRPYSPGNHATNVIGAINWVLYCVPENLDLPYDQRLGGTPTTGVSCGTSEPPFYDGGP